MIKRYCDCCGKLMNDTQFEAGHLTAIKKIMLDTNQRVEKKEMDLCDNCVNSVWKLLQEIKKEKENKNI